jgi:hypothetical protein
MVGNTRSENDSCDMPAVITNMFCNSNGNSSVSCTCAISAGNI